jgi:hypothetical protein
VSAGTAKPRSADLERAYAMDSTDGIFGLLQSAVKGERDTGFATISGDLNQMSIQKEFLRGQGFDLGQSDVYPIVRTEEDWKRALGLFWKYKVQGWWHYEAHYVKYSICSKEEFSRALSR